MAPVHIPNVENVAWLTGPNALGYMWSYCLYGMLIIQLYTYCNQFPNDRLQLKLLVWSMFILESVFTLFMTIAAWNAYGPGWGDPETLGRIDWSWAPLPPISGVLALVAQSFYAWRIWRLGKKSWLPICVICVGATSAIAIIYIDVVFFMRGHYVPTLFELETWIIVWLSCGALCDMMITVSLISIFKNHQKNTGYRDTMRTINKLIRFNVETGFITSVISIVQLVLFISTGHQWNLHFMFFLILGKLYANTLVATLNYRELPFSNGGSGDSSTVIMSSMWADGSRFDSMAPSYGSYPGCAASSND